MKVLIISVDHRAQIVPLRDEAPIPEKERLRTLVREVVASRNVDLICEESDPRHLSIAQEEAFRHNPRIPWKNIYMTSQERLEVGIWEALLNRPWEPDFGKGIAIEHRVLEDDAREQFFKDEILKAAKETKAKSVLVLCGDMHTEPLKAKLEDAGQAVETNRGLTPEKHWK